MWKYPIYNIQDIWDEDRISLGIRLHKDCVQWEWINMTIHKDKIKFLETRPKKSFKNKLRNLFFN
jgi:hypothetical protein